MGRRNLIYHRMISRARRSWGGRKMEESRNGLDWGSGEVGWEDVGLGRRSRELGWGVGMELGSQGRRAAQWLVGEGRGPRRGR